MAPPFPNQPIPSYYRSFQWKSAGSKRNGVHYVGDVVALTLTVALSENVTYTIRNYYGETVSTGSVLSGATSFTPTVPSGGWDPGWYRVYLTGAQSDANFFDSYGATNFCVIRNDASFVPMPAGNTVGATQTASDQVMKGVLGVGTTRLSISDASNPTNDPGNGQNIAGATADLARTNTYWVAPGAPYADSARPRYAWLDFPGGGVDMLQVGTGSMFFMCADESIDGDQVFVEVQNGTNPGTRKVLVSFPNSGTLVETYDNLPTANQDAISTAINGVSDYIVFYWDTPGLFNNLAQTAIGRDFYTGVGQVVAALYPLGCTHYEGPRNEPSQTTQSRGFVTHMMRLFSAAVHDGHPDAQVMGPAFVDLFWNDTRGWYAFFNSGGHEYCDAISFHAYNAQTNGDINLGRSTFDAFFALMAQFDVDLPLWQTESTHAFSSVYGVYHPRRSRVYILETLLQEQYGIPKEQNNAWYDLSHGFWNYPAWLENGDGSLNPQAVLYRVLAEETWGKPYVSALDFGTPGNNIFLGNVYTGAEGTTIALMATSFMENASVTLRLSGASSPVTVVDGFGNESSVPTSAGRLNIPLTDAPSYVRLPVGASATVYTVNDWSTTNIGSSLTPSAISKEIDSVSYPVIANNAYMTNYAAGTGIAPTTFAEPPSVSEVVWTESQTISRVLVWAGPSWQQSGTPVEFSVETTSDGVNWTSRATVSKSMDYLEFGSDAQSVGCFIETYWDEQWVFDIELNFPVDALGLRISVSEASYGGEPLASSGFGQGNDVQGYRIEEIGAFLETSGGGGMAGPCTPWITGDDVAECCSVESTAGFEFEAAAQQASALLFELSGRLFPGECGPKTVRPACHSCACGYQILSRGHIVGPWDYGYPLWGMCDLCLVACSPSRVKLSGYPVRSITEIKIDGDVVDPSLYTIYKSRYVSRLDNGRWPIRQNLTLADTEDHTFSISYTYGADAPDLGQAAAAQLACEIYKSCAGGGAAGECVLPQGVTRVTRQGITIEKLAFTSWGYIGKNNRGFAPGWRTGLSLVDSFLNAYNRPGLLRRPTFWAPGSHRYAQEMG